MAIEIASIDTGIIHYVSTNDGEEYTRHGADNWRKSYGMSDETVTDPTEIEKAFQKAMDTYA